MSLHEVRVAEVVDQGHRQRAIRLEPIGTELPAFEAGAHVDLHLPDGLIRQYSIASAPHARDHYLLCVKLADASRGGSRHLCEQLAAGDRLQISTPRNLFPLHAGERHVLLAAGIGITPLLSMAEALEARGEAFVLHYYARRQADVAFGQRLQQGFQHGQVQVHLSDDGESPRVHIPTELRQAHTRDQLYLCGPAAFMDHFSALALAQGWAPAQLHREHFAAVAPAVPHAADDAFEVELAASGRVVQVAVDCSIANALMAAGVEVPLSCEQGMCGACLTGVLDGVPDHRDSVLSDSEHAQNTQITLCCSRSRTPRLVLDL
ncbi:PDR/VanB family oxidoreductase [Xanthomonas campestris]|uniref:PDR/VanB family oxidoreductase n=1 Tax=Xanthomonas campestris TaxID=339 RepID=UPI0008A16CD4|nr:PDR/VanB family oxidoreductase [Xanthomonas campestris]MEB1152690.1 PDR/VanB family oxidoreductase [Xanthomonas campestris pv. campestris]MCC5098951.1 PDR/VanB family oxidoreductase [Xanthomonas campestris]MEA9584749.1 PDR/VanB family oxidoreductase [Xanthomonas campestris]MEA9593072.1 PDR/VanB family oxidoreductase [Xanthomonas campestris]MEA9624829.1 PDR/VanB family oxidoreductase [Xanthomonas campestris]